MKDRIGLTAGKIWEILREKEEISISQIPKIVKEPDAVTYQALGWLAREGKIEYNVRKNRTSIFLSEHAYYNVPV